MVSSGCETGQINVFIVAFKPSISLLIIFFSVYSIFHQYRVLRQLNLGISMVLLLLLSGLLYIFWSHFLSWNKFGNVLPYCWITSLIIMQWLKCILSSSLLTLYENKYMSLFGMMFAWDGSLFSFWLSNELYPCK